MKNIPKDFSEFTGTLLPGSLFNKVVGLQPEPMKRDSDTSVYL